jgi:hypothetical protein
MAFQARLKSQYVAHYPGLNGVSWYEVEPLWAGLKERSTNLLGQRLVRLKLGTNHITVIAEHCDLRQLEDTAGTTAE